MPFSFRLDPDLKEAVFREARLEGRPVSGLMRQATREYVGRMSRFRVMVGELEEEADKGVFISGEAMRAWIESWDTDNELPPLEPDIFPDQSEP